MKRFTPYLIILLLFFFSCDQDSDPVYTIDKLSGIVQKGPYINGTAITIAELNTNLNPTGNTFSTQIIDNKGSFEIKEVELNFRYVEIRADGFYFDEVKGEKSAAQLTLFGLSDVSNKSSINVNLMTQLEKGRVEYLMGEGLSFDEAKEQAQSEVIQAFGFSYDNMISSELLDISDESEANAILLAISIILQGNRSVGDLTELIANFNTDIREDGIFNSVSSLADLRASTLLLDLDIISTNLINRYESLGITTNLPNFEKYIASFLAYTADKPAVRILNVSDITAISATLNGSVNANSSSTIVSFEYGSTSTYGNVVAASQSPITGNSETTVSAIISDLNPGETYHFRIIAENDLGSVVSDDSSFSTTIHGITGTVSDHDGNIYNTIGIGHQMWMAENLKTTKYNDDTAIPLVTDDTEWQNLTTPGYCWYNNDETTYKNTNGALYNWHTVNTNKLCPSGWHVPTDAEWTELENYLIANGYNYDGTTSGNKIGKALASTSGWNASSIIGTPGNDQASNNSTGFAALPVGFRISDFTNEIGENSILWSSSEASSMGAWSRVVGYDLPGVFRTNFGEKFGFPVRCIRDN